MIADLVAASRSLSWINTAYPFAVAYLLVAREFDAVLIVGALFFLVPYNLAMYGINDVFDYASDLANPRKGGAEGAVLAPQRHRAVLIASAATCLPFLVFLVISGSPASWAVLAASMFAVVAYSSPPMRFKEIPVLDSITSSTHFVSPALYGIVLAGGRIDGAAMAVLGAFFLWGMASHAFGAVQDVIPDRDAGIASVATALGAARTVRLAITAWLLAGALMLTTGWPAALASILCLPYIALAAPFRRVSDAASATANRGWRRFLWVNYACGAAITILLLITAMNA